MRCSVHHSASSAESTLLDALDERRDARSRRPGGGERPDCTRHGCLSTDALYRCFVSGRSHAGAAWSRRVVLGCACGVLLSWADFAEFKFRRMTRGHMVDCCCVDRLVGQNIEISMPVPSFCRLVESPNDAMVCVVSNHVFLGIIVLLIWSIVERSLVCVISCSISLSDIRQHGDEQPHGS